MVLSQFASSYHEETKALKLVKRADPIGVRVGRLLGKAAAKVVKSSATLVQATGVVGANAGVYLLFGLGVALLVGGLVLVGLGMLTERAQVR